MIDSVLSLAFSIKANRGAYALMLGSGVSASARIPTGWGVVCDLIEKLAAMLGEDAGAEPWTWYEQRFGHEPDYSSLLDSLARTPAERNRLLTAYFEPTPEELENGWKQPTPAHRAVAEMMAAGYLRLVLTTNFDRLLEKALSEFDVNPKVIASPDDIEGALPLMHADRPMVIKVNGDYLDTRSKNTPEELRDYDERLSAMLERVFADCGLIIAGWSGRYDTALIDAYRRGLNQNFSTVWIGRGDLSAPARELLDLRGGEYLNQDSDEFFAALADKVLAEERKARFEAEKPALERTPNNLPKPLTSFIGRERSLSGVGRLLASQRLVTLVGPGGTGKTRLAIRVAEAECASYSGGVWFVDLAPVADPDLLPQATAAALGLKEAPDESLTHTLVHALQDKDSLLILDNCEHLVDGAAAFSAELLAACPGLDLLATSRETLGIDGEECWPVKALGLPAPGVACLPTVEEEGCESVRLFIERARAASGNLEVDADALECIGSICRRLDGIPLAIELAAARCLLLTPRQIDEKLDQRFRLLTSGARSASERQKTLRGAIDWSHELLETDERRLFARLSVFNGDFGFTAVAVICAEPDQDEFELLDILAQLVRKSLVTPSRSGPEPRYRLLESMRAYADEKLADLGERELLRERHFEFYRDLVDAHRRDLVGAQQAEWFDRFDAEHDNLRHALSWTRDRSDPVAGLNMAANMAQFWHFRGHLTEAAGWYSGFIADPEALPKEMLARGHALLGNFCNIMADYPAARRAYSLAAALAEEQGNRRIQASLLHNISFIERRCGDVARAREHAERALELFSEGEDRRLVAMGLSNVGSLDLLAGDHDSARERLNAAREISVAIGDRQGLSNNLTHLGLLAQTQGDLDLAGEHFADALAIRRELDYHSGIAFSLSLMANLAMDRGQLEDAEQALAEAERIYGEHGLMLGQAEVELQYGRLIMTGGDRDEARSRILSGLAQSQSLDSSTLLLLGVELLARLESDEGHLDLAASYMGAASRFRRETGQPPPTALADLLPRLEPELGRLAGADAGSAPPSLTEAVQDALSDPAGRD